MKKTTNNKPPKVIKWLLKAVLTEEEYYEKIGDFEEDFIYKTRDNGKLRTLIRCYSQLLKALPVFIKNSICWRFTMIRNYLKITLRTFRKEKLYSFISIAGLVLGLACSYVIMLYVLRETSYDHFHKNADNIYRILTHIEKLGGTNAKSPYPLTPHIKENFPEIKKITRYRADEILIGHENNFFRLKNLARVDPEFFEIFSFPIINGNRKNPIQDPHSIVLTREIAEKIFGDKDPVGQTVAIRNKRGISFDTKIHSMTVTAVAENLPFNTHITAEVFISIESVKWGYENINRKRAIPYFETWSPGFYTYIRTSDDFSPHEFEQKLAKYITSNEQLLKNGKYYAFEFKLQPLKNIHLNKKLILAETGKKGDITKVYIYSIVAFLILFIAVINYTTLSTARSAVRAKEIGVRKIVGASRADIVKQVTFESVFFLLTALPLALLLIIFILPAVNNLLRTDLSISLFGETRFIFLYLFITILTGFISGAYISFYLSSFKPLAIIRRKLSFVSSKSYFRNFLVFLQLSIFFLLLVSSAVIYKQLLFMTNKNKLGYEVNDRICVNAGDRFLDDNKLIVFKNELKKHESIENVTLTFYDFLSNASGRHRTLGKEFNLTSEKIIKDYFIIRNDYDIVETLGLTLVEGESFSEKYKFNGKVVIVNETLVKEYDLKDPIGKEYIFIDEKLRIIGIVKDFHSSSFYSSIAPMVFYNRHNFLSNYYIKIKPGQTASALSFIEQKWKEMNPNGALEFAFLDEKLDGLYQNEKNFGKIIGYFTLLAVFISAMGLFGLSLFSAEQKTKEIGIRKIMGATVGQIIKLLSSQYIIIAVLSFCVSIPVSWYIMNKWLEDFAYRINITAAIFILSALLTLLIVFITISFHIFKAAGKNPVDTLRYE